MKCALSLASVLFRRTRAVGSTIRVLGSVMNCRVKSALSLVSVPFRRTRTDGANLPR
jgi:hypothetical protein